MIVSTTFLISLHDFFIKKHQKVDVKNWQGQRPRTPSGLGQPYRDLLRNRLHIGQMALWGNLGGPDRGVPRPQILMIFWRKKSFKKRIKNLFQSFNEWKKFHWTTFDWLKNIKIMKKVKKSQKWPKIPRLGPPLYPPGTPKIAIFRDFWHFFDFFCYINQFYNINDVNIENVQRYTSLSCT